MKRQGKEIHQDFDGHNIQLSSLAPIKRLEVLSQLAEFRKMLINARKKKGKVL
ncbi:MAG: hypothetical protein PHW04_11540 [Candidatus Wallbacteria bacterium]|nr:hypothetical protein [Candidatus Wallbacteria bacterium]